MSLRDRFGHRLTHQQPDADGKDPQAQGDEDDKAEHPERSPGVIAQSNYVLSAPGYAIDPNYSLAVASDGGGGYLLQLTFTPVPEPATVFALAAGALGLGGLVRRRLRRA